MVSDVDVIGAFAALSRHPFPQAAIKQPVEHDDRDEREGGPFESLFPFRGIGVVIHGVNMSDGFGVCIISDVCGRWRKSDQGITF